MYYKLKSREFVDSRECVTHIIGHIPQIANHRADLFHILLHLVFSCVICNLGHKGSAWNVHTRLGRVATSWTLNWNYNSISSITILILIALMYYSIELIFKIYETDQLKNQIYNTTSLLSRQRPLLSFEQLKKFCSKQKYWWEKFVDSECKIRETIWWADHWF